MKLNLQKPLVIFDLETTGLDIVKDRAIQLSYIKVYPDGREVRGNEIINPEKPIPDEVVALTGISNEDGSTRISPAQPRLPRSRRLIPTDFLTAASPSRT